MATIAELIIGVSVDPSGVRQGIGEIGQVMATAANKSIGAFEQLGRQLDVTNARAVQGFRAQGDALAANLVALNATEAELNHIATVIQRVERAAGAASVSGASPLGGGLFGAGANMLRALGPTTSGLTQLGNVFEGLSYRAQRTGVAVAFAFEQFARGGEAGERGIVRALRSVSLLATAFGPEGLLVAAAAAGGAAIIDYFDTARKEIEKTRKKFDDEIGHLMDDFDQLKLEQQLRVVEIGRPGAGLGIGGGYAGSLADIQGQMNAAIEQFKQADANWNYRLKTTAEANIRRLGPQLEELIRERSKILGALYNPQVLPGMERPIAGLAPVNIQVNSPLKQAAEDAKEAAKQLKQMNEEMARLFQWLNQPGARIFLPTQLTPGAPLHIPSPTAQSLPADRAMTPTRVELLPIVQSFQNMAKMVGNEMISAFGPVALLFKVMEPGIRILDQLFDKLLAPLTAVVEVLAAGLEPVFRLLFPIVRDVAIAISYLAEIIDRVAAALTRFIGNIVTAIGALIAHIPFLGGLGHAIENVGKSILNYSDGITQAANEMHDTRKRLEGMQFGQTADEIAQLGDAAAATTEQLLNIPTGFKVMLDYLTYVTQAPVGMAGHGGSGALVAGSGGRGSITLNGDVYVDARSKPISEALNEMKAELQVRARSLSGDVAHAAEVWNH